MGYILQLLLPVGLAALSYFFMQPQHWDQSRQGLMVALSVLCAAIFVRLARGLPLTTTEFFEVDEIRKLSEAVKTVMVRMIVLIVVALVSILGLAFISVGHDIIAKVAFLSPEAKDVGSRLLTAALMLLTTFSFVRATHVIRGDYDLVELQSKLVTRAVERRKAKEEAERLQKAEEAAPFKTREGYGGLVQH